MSDFYILKIDSNNNLNDIIRTYANSNKKKMQNYYNTFNDEFRYIVFYATEFEKLNFRFA